VGAQNLLGLLLSFFMMSMKDSKYVLGISRPFQNLKKKFGFHSLAHFQSLFRGLTYSLGHTLGLVWDERMMKKVEFLFISYFSLFCEN
jgi:hypothetical protein